MKWNLLLLGIFAWLKIASGLPHSPSLNSNTPIRVLLAKGIEEATVTSGKGQLFYSMFEHGPWKPMSESITLKMMRKRGRSSLSINGKDSYSTLIFIRYGTSGGPLVYLDKNYPGSLQALINDDKLSLVNSVPIETYLVGVLSGEMNENWPMEALKAQAVAARSYAYYKIRFSKANWYDLENTVYDQVFAGIENRYVKLAQAVRETKDLVLTENGQLAQTLFHSRCGGKTENASAVWAKVKTKKNESVDCPGCRQSSFQWETKVSLIKLLQKVGLPSESNAFAIVEKNRGESGRPSQITLHSKDKQRVLTADELRSLVGYQKMRSTQFDWSVNGDELIFVGKGAGHGVGLCQWGAKFLAEKGKSFTEILRHYYPTKQLHLLSPQSVGGGALASLVPSLSPEVRSPRRLDGLPNRTSSQPVASRGLRPRSK